MDDGHNTAIVYHAQDHIWYCVTLAIHDGPNPPKHVITAPFPIHRPTPITLTTTSLSPAITKTSSTIVTAIGGLHRTILSILTSDYILTTVDTNRATILNEIDVRSLFRNKFGIANLGKVRISTHHSGTIVIVNYDSTESPSTAMENGISGGAGAITPMNGTKMTNKTIRHLASVCSARITLFDQGRQRPSTMTDSGMGYDLCGVVASSVATTMNDEGRARMRSRLPMLASSVEMNMETWFPMRRKKKNKNQIIESSSSMALTVVGSDGVMDGADQLISAMVMKLKSFWSSDEDGKQVNRNHTFLRCFKEVELGLLNDNDKRRLSSSRNRLFSQQCIIENDIPQTIIDTSLSIAVDRILNPRTSRTDRIDANDVLLRCVRSGKVSGHAHLEKATSCYSRQGDDNIFFSILLSLDYQGAAVGSDGKPFDNTTAVVTDKSSSPQSLLLIDTILEYCRDSVPEHMLVTMLHFVVCHVTQDQMALYWDNTGVVGCRRAMVSQGVNASMKSLEDQLKVAREWMTNAENTKDGKLATINGRKDIKDKGITKMLKDADELMKLVSNNTDTDRGNDHNDKKSKENQEGVSKKVQRLISNLQTRSFTHQQMHFVRKIVTFSKCNEALLRTALKHGLTQADNGEVEVLMKILTKLLEYTGTITSQSTRSPPSSTAKSWQTINPTVCIVQWLSALTDSHMGMLYSESMSSTSNFGENKMERIRSRVSSAMAQGNVLLNLKDLLRHVDVVFEKVEGNELLSKFRKRKRARISMNSNIPVYSIESLNF